MITVYRERGILASGEAPSGPNRRDSVEASRCRISIQAIGSRIERPSRFDR